MIARRREFSIFRAADATTRASTATPPETKGIKGGSMPSVLTGYGSAIYLSAQDEKNPIAFSTLVGKLLPLAMEHSRKEWTSARARGLIVTIKKVDPGR
jgi:hypothetical protein